MNPFDLDSIIEQKLNSSSQGNQVNHRNNTPGNTPKESRVYGSGSKVKVKPDKPGSKVNAKPNKPSNKVNAKRDDDKLLQRYEEIAIDSVNLGDYLRFTTEDRSGEPSIGGVLKKITDNPDGTRTLSIRIKRGNSYTWLNYNSRGIKKVYRFLKDENTPSNNAANNAPGNNMASVPHPNNNPEEKSKIERLGDHLLFGDVSDNNKKRIEDLTTRVQSLETELTNLKANLKALFPIIKRGAEAYDAIQAGAGARDEKQR